MLGKLLGTIFGNNRNLFSETIEVFRPNAERAAVRSFELDAATTQQFAAEFAVPRRGVFDRFVDSLNRLPRPLMVIGMLYVLVYTVRDPIEMSKVFAAWALIPEYLWVIFGIIVTFFFGGRAQAKDHQFQADLARTLSRTSSVVKTLDALDDLGDEEEHEQSVSVAAVNENDADEVIQLNVGGNLSDNPLAEELRKDLS